MNNQLTYLLLHLYLLSRRIPNKTNCAVLVAGTYIQCSATPYLLSVEAENTNVIIFGLTQSALEPTIYCTRSEHANDYMTDAVWFDVGCSFY
jgi:hypothetical protein